MLLQRFLTFVVVGPFLIAAIVTSQTWIFKGIILIGLILGLNEFLTIAGITGASYLREKTTCLLLGTYHLAFLIFCPDVPRYALFEISVLVISLLGFIGIASKQPIADRIRNVAFAFLGIIYLGLGSFIAALRDLPHGLFWVLGLLAMTWLNDTFAYFAGHRFGKTRLAPSISPGKTVEGFLGGMVGTMTGFLACWYYFDQPIPLLSGLGLSLVIAIIGPLGDLSESLLKRSFGVKDSGHLIPGHGGMLDRIDALLFTAPAAYLWSYFFVS